MEQTTEAIPSTLLKLPSEYPNLVYVVARSHRHASVQMRNYGYTNFKGDINVAIREYYYVDYADQLRGLNPITVWVLDGTQYCECRRLRYEEILETILPQSNRFKVVLVPEIDPEQRIVTRSIYDLRNREE